MTIVFGAIDEFRAAAGTDLGAGPWMQSRNFSGS